MTLDDFLSDILQRLGQAEAEIKVLRQEQQNMAKIIKGMGDTQ